jgi:magnesium-transporting ATPase (P-type)
MLTGDKKETAVSIGYSCGLVDPTNEIITLDCEPEHAKGLIKNVLGMIDMIK